MEVESLKAERVKVNSSMKDIIHGAEGYKVRENETTRISSLSSVIHLINIYVKYLFIMSVLNTCFNALSFSPDSII